MHSDGKGRNWFSLKTFSHIPGLLMYICWWIDQAFLESHFRNISGRYTVYIPFHFGEPIFLDSRSLTVKTLYVPRKRLTREPLLYEEYSEFLCTYLENDHMSLVIKNSIPQHLIVYRILVFFNPNGSTTKFHVVFDPSALGDWNSLLIIKFIYFFS